jgi:hypothetical protein
MPAWLGLGVSSPGTMSRRKKGRTLLVVRPADWEMGQVYLFGSNPHFTRLSRIMDLFRFLPVDLRRSWKYIFQHERSCFAGGVGFR